MVSGKDFPVALSSVNIVKAKGGSVLLAGGTISEKDKKYINSAKDVYTVGGKNSVSEKMIESLFGKINIHH